MEEILAQFTGLTSIDFETSGLDPFQPNSYIRAVSLASSEACIAIDLLSLDQPVLDLFWVWAQAHPGFIFHNAAFDTLWAAVHGKPIKIKACTSALFRHVATEGELGQSWSLKTAMTDVLGWESPNTIALYMWLDQNRLGKNEMSKAPWELLGPYAALDADATIQLFVYLSSVIDRLPKHLAENMWEYHYCDTINLIELVTEAQIEGMTVNVEKLQKYGEELKVLIAAEIRNFVEEGAIKKVLSTLKTAQIEALSIAEPEEMTKTGQIAKRWQSWAIKVMEQIDAPLSEIFNIDSPQQLSWLMYEKLGYKVMRETEGGAASVDAKSLPYLGDGGRVLMKYRKLREKLKFVTAALNVQQNGLFHPTLKVAATVTGRCAGGSKQ